MFSTGGGREEERKKDTTVGGAEAHARFRQYEYRAVSCASHPRRQISLYFHHPSKRHSQIARSLCTLLAQVEVKHIIARFRVTFALRNAL